MIHGTCVSRDCKFCWSIHSSPAKASPPLASIQPAVPDSLHVDWRRRIRPARCTLEEKYDKERAIEEQRKAWDESHTIAAAISQQPGISAMACSQLKPPDYVYVTVHAPSATDETLKRLSETPRIGSLHVYGGSVTDSGVRHLAKLTRLQYLSIRAKNVTDGALPHLAGMSKLRRLDLKSANVTDAGVSELQKCFRIARSFEVSPKMSRAGGWERSSCDR